MLLVILTHVCSVGRSIEDGGVSLEAIKAMMVEHEEHMREQWRRQMAEFEVKMVQKDETIAALADALKSKTDHKRVEMAAGGEVMQLVSEADLTDLATRLVACEKTNAEQDAKLAQMQRSGDGGVGGRPPSFPLQSPRPVATPNRRRLGSSSEDNTNEIAITGRNAVLSWNSHTPDLTPFNCTAVGNGILTCSGEVHLADVVTSRGNSLNALADLLLPEVHLRHFFWSGNGLSCRDGCAAIGLVCNNQNSDQLTTTTQAEFESVANAANINGWLARTRHKGASQDMYGIGSNPFSCTYAGGSSSFATPSIISKRPEFRMDDGVCLGQSGSSSSCTATNGDGYQRLCYCSRA